MYDDLLGKKADEADEADETGTKAFMDKLKRYTDCIEGFDCSQCDSDCMYAHL